MANSRALPGQQRPLSLAALDSAISETIGRPVRRDRLARDDRVYRWVCRRAIAEGACTFRTTYAEAAAGAGYEVPRLNSRENRREARHMRVSTIYRALSSLRAAGLVEFEGTKKTNGQWRCLCVRILPGGMGAPPAGRSRRRPSRRPGSKISFSPQSGTSPAVDLAVKQPDHGRSAGARAGEALEQPAINPPGSKSSVRNEIAASLREAQSPGVPWQPWRDLHHQELVEVVEAFELHFDRPARFSYRKHGPYLRRILDRLDRYTSGPGLAGKQFPGDGHKRRGSGVEAATTIVEALGEDARLGLQSAVKIQSLAYLLPIFDHLSKDRRRQWKRRWGAKEREDKWNASS